MLNDLKSILISKEEINTLVEKIAKKIQEEYIGQDLTLICILKGSCVFFSDLIRCINMPVSIDFMEISSYGDSTSSGEIVIKKDLSADIKGKNVIIVEDIIDTGKTLNLLKIKLQKREPNSLKICSLLIKPTRHQYEIVADYFGTNIPDEFVVGYGLDFAGKYRNLPSIGILKEEIYK